MITVAILINGQPLMARSAVNQRRERHGKTVYLCDDGTEVYHDPKDGAVPLAVMMLGTIIQPRLPGVARDT